MTRSLKARGPECEAGHAAGSISRVWLERPFGEKTRIHLDICVELDGCRTAIELKYWPAPIDLVVDGERFHFRSNVAHDIARYDFLKDFVRVEKLVEDDLVDDGYVLAVTNDALFWKAGKLTVCSGAGVYGVEADRGECWLRVRRGCYLADWQEGREHGFRRRRSCADRNARFLDVSQREAMPEPCSKPFEEACRFGLAESTLDEGVECRGEPGQQLRSVGIDLQNVADRAHEAEVGLRCMSRADERHREARRPGFGQVQREPDGSEAYIHVHGIVSGVVS